MVPPWARTIAWTIVSPSPVPSMARSCGRSAEEAVEQATLLGDRDPDAVVRDGKHEIVAGHPQSDHDAPTVLGELDRVRDEVVEHLAQAGGVAHHGRHRVGVETQVDAARVRGRPQDLDRLRGEIGEVDLLRLERELPGFDLRDEEQVAHEPQEPVGVAVHDLEEAPVLLREVGVVEDELEVAGDRGQRGAQLVGNERDELVLQAVELAQPVVLLQKQPLRGLGLVQRGALAFVERLPLGDRALELADEPGEASKDEERQRGRTDDDGRDFSIPPETASSARTAGAAAEAAVRAASRRRVSAGAAVGVGTTLVAIDGWSAAQPIAVYASSQRMPSGVVSQALPATWTPR
jgi:hypothetical protein